MVRSRRRFIGCVVSKLGGRRRRAVVLALCVNAAIAGFPGRAPADGPGPPKALGYPPPVAAAPLPAPEQPQTNAQSSPTSKAGSSGEGPEAPNAQLIEGTGEFVNTPSSTDIESRDAAGDITLDFADADVRDVIRSVLGEILKVPYVIDPLVNGRLTLKTGSPIRPDAVLPALETALKIDGAAIVVTDGVYTIVPLATAQKQSAQVTTASIQSGTAGYGIEVVPLKFISADEMQKVLDPLVPQGGILRVDPQRNLIFLAGTEPERASIRATIALFDVDYLKGMSFALIQPQHVDVGTLSTELAKIFDQTSSPIAGLVRLIPIARINTLLVLTARASYLHEVSRWVARLDVVPVTPGRQLHYYRLQSAHADDVAQTLGELFGGAGTPRWTDQNPSMSMNGQAGTPSTSQYGQGPSGSFAQPAQGSQFASSAQPPDHIAPPGTANGGSADAPQIVTDEANNALIIRADAAEYDSIEKIIRQMDVTPDQVMIEATIVEVTLNDTLQYGVEWYFRSGNQTFAQAATGTPAASFPGFGFTYTVPNLSVAMSALGTLSKITVISSPKLLTLDNRPATLEVGDQVPIVTQTAVSSSAADAPLVSTVQQLATGVILSVTPRIGSSGMVFLTIAQEVSEAVPTTIGFTQSPTIQQRKIQTTVAIADGATVALGGMIRRSQTSGNSGVPYLKDIPVLGGVFGSQNDTRERTELLVFLTPRVVRSPLAAAAVTDDLRKALDGARETLDYFAHRKKDIPRLPWR